MPLDLRDTLVRNGEEARTRGQHQLVKRTVGVRAVLTKPPEKIDELKKFCREPESRLQGETTPQNFQSSDSAAMPLLSERTTTGVAEHGKALRLPRVLCRRASLRDPRVCSVSE